MGSPNNDRTETRSQLWEITMTALKINRNSYKIGINEIEGLESVLRVISKPVLDSIKDRVYWDSSLKFEVNEYTSRDGFIAHSHNCGGLELHTVIPKCEEYNFGFLKFGELDEYDLEQMSKMTENEASDYESEQDSSGHLDASLRVWLKFEGLNDEGHMMFYFYVGGGNGDAPYFRTEYEATVFESSFTCKTLAELKRVGKREVSKILKAIA
jgi:hypothetical protein